MKKLAILLLILIGAIGYFFLETKPFSVEPQDDLVADNSELINPNLCTGRFTDFEPCLQLKASFSEKEITKKDKTSEEFLALGIRYELGIDVTADHKKALEYYLESAKKADDAGYALISYSLMKEYIWNVNPDIDIDKADYSVNSFGEHSENLFYRMADKFITSEVTDRFAYRYRLAAAILKEVNKTKYPHAYILLSDIYIQGIGVEVDRSKGLEYLTQGADAKYPYAIAMLGSFYLTGSIVEKNEELGYQLIQEAIDLEYDGPEKFMRKLNLELFMLQLQE